MVQVNYMGKRHGLELRVRGTGKRYAYGLRVRDSGQRKEVWFRDTG